MQEKEAIMKKLKRKLNGKYKKKCMLYNRECTGSGNNGVCNC